MHYLKEGGQIMNKKLYLLALPLSLTLGASGAVDIKPGSPHRLIESVTLIDSATGLKIQYPPGFGTIKVSPGSKLYTHMFSVKNGSTAGMSTPFPKWASLYHARDKILDKNLDFNMKHITASNFKTTLETLRKLPSTKYRGYVAGSTVDFQAAVLKLSFGKDLAGKTAVLNFASYDYHFAGKPVNALGSFSLGTTLKRKGDGSRAIDKLLVYLRQACAYHATTAEGLKGNSVPCDISEFGAYANAKSGSFVDKYQLSLRGVKDKYFTSTLAFFVETIDTISDSYEPRGGEYVGNLDVTFTVEG